MMGPMMPVGPGIKGTLLLIGAIAIGLIVVYVMGLLFVLLGGVMFLGGIIIAAQVTPIKGWPGIVLGLIVLITGLVLLFI